MGRNLQFKRGMKQDLPNSALSGMPLWCIDTKELFIGNENEVVKIGGSDEQTVIEDYLVGGTYNLQLNTIYKLTLYDSTTLQLPYPEVNGTFNQILIQLEIMEKVSLDLGTQCFFNGIVPDFSEMTLCDIYYEFDGNVWTVGVLKKEFSN